MDKIALPTLPPTDTEFQPVMVKLYRIKEGTLNKTMQSRITRFLHEHEHIDDVAAASELKPQKRNAVEKKQEEKEAKEEEKKEKERRRTESEFEEEQRRHEEHRVDGRRRGYIDETNEYAPLLPVNEPPFKNPQPISAYYMNNRKIFVPFIEKLFENYRREHNLMEKDITCDNVGRSTKMELMAHQRLIRDYLNLYTPYRGLLLIHGLGSGKTCSSIGIAEGFRNQRRIIVMTPAYLQSNYVNEIKKCGDILFRLKQHWTFIKAEAGEMNDAQKEVAYMMGLTDKYVKKKGGFWLMDSQKNDEPNYNTLSEDQQKSLEDQLDLMIRHKYQFINYNGISLRKFNKLTNNGKDNLFDNSVVVIDEVHNLVSWIVNKLNKVKGRTKTVPLAIAMYRMLMSAQNTRVVALSGTPLLNYPNESAVLFNILRGYIYTFSYKLDDTNRAAKKGKKKGAATEDNDTVDTNFFMRLFKNAPNSRGKMVDYIQYYPSRKELVITRNPLDFANVYSINEAKSKATGTATYQGVDYEPDYQLDLTEFKKQTADVLMEAGFGIKKMDMTLNVALPDSQKDFENRFMDVNNKTIKHLENFKRRIVGLVSYFRSADEALLPQFDKKTDIHLEMTPMSDFQFSIYAQARIEERAKEEAAKKRNAMKRGQGMDMIENEDEKGNSYRIYSRLFCNFVFPTEIVRPIATRGKKKKGDEDEDGDQGDDDEQGDDEQKGEDHGNKNLMVAEDEAMEGAMGDAKYAEKIQQAMSQLSERRDEFLRMPHLLLYSPKYARMLENLNSLTGKQLIYSQFRTMEGIGILALTLDTNGYEQFRIRRMHGSWELDVSDISKLGKTPMYALYTGTEDKEEREIVRHIYNGDWDLIPQNIRRVLEETGKDNVYGDIIKVIMITASGSEGINLMETRYVHILEPYWNAIRSEQVIGRARRICSHRRLPLEHQTVEVFLYMTKFTKKQVEEEPELNLHDVGKLDGNRNRALTTDEALYEIGQIKDMFNSRLIKGMKEAAIDCTVYADANANEGVRCMQFPAAKPNEFMFNPDYQTDPDIMDVPDTAAPAQTAPAQTVAKVIEFKGEKYAYEPASNNVYEYDTYADKTLRRKVGTLDKKTGKVEFI